MTNLTKLRERIGELVPGTVTGGWLIEPELFLADVLRAIRHKPNGIANCRGLDGDYLEVHPSVGKLFVWNLSKPLSGQSEETINWLYKLLK